MNRIVWIALVALVFSAWGGAEAARSKRKPSVSEKAAAAVKREFPKGEITRALRQKRAVVVYQIAVADGEDTVDMAVTEDGQGVDITCQIDKTHLPRAVAKTLADKAGDAEIKQVVCQETRAEVMIVKLRTRQVVYQVGFTKDGEEVELTIDRSGKLLLTDIQQ
jgi:uncharacterized membrane protein YkoI